MALALHTAPSVEPVTATEMLAQCRISHTDDNTLLEAYITAARQWVEEYVQRTLIETTWTFTLDSFCDPIRPPRPPLRSIVSIDYVDSAGDSAELDVDDDILVDTVSEPGRVTPVYGTSWPSTQDQVNAVTIEFKAGYGTAAASVPMPIKQAIKLLAAHWYENREGVVVGQIPTEVPFTVKALLDPFKVWEYR